MVATQVALEARGKRPVEKDQWKRIDRKELTAEDAKDAEVN